MRVIVDSARCEGYGICAETAEDLMHLDDDGVLVIDALEIEPAAAPRAAAAVRACPVAALGIRE